jgi:hypothetical protein
MSNLSSNLVLPYLAAGQAQKHVTVNETIRKLDAVVQLGVVSATTTAEPGSPADGAVYIVPAGKTGTHWAGFANWALAYWRDGAWEQISPRDGWIAWVADVDQAVAFDGSRWRGLPSPGANRLINAGFAINQRGLASNADDTYCFDRWYVLTQSGAIAASALSDPESGRPTGIRLTQSQASAQRIGLAQIVEAANIKDLRDRAVAMTARVRCSASQAIRVAILEWAGTADSVTSDVVNDWTDSSFTAGHFFLGSNLNVIAVGATTPAAATWTDMDALAGVFGASLNNAIVIVWSEGTLAQNATLDLDQVQLEPGALCSPFRRPAMGDELACCLRYYEKSFARATPPAQNAGPNTGETIWNAVTAGATGQRTGLRFNAQKRAAPTVTLYNPQAANAQIRDQIVDADFTGSVAFNVTENGMSLFGTGAAATAAGNRVGVHWTADAEL